MPDARKKQVSISLTEEEKRKLEAIAASMGHTTSSLVAAIANGHLTPALPQDLSPLWGQIGGLWQAIEDLRYQVSGQKPPAPHENSW